MGCMRYLSEAHLRGFERYKVSSSKKRGYGLLDKALNGLGGKNQCPNWGTHPPTLVNSYLLYIKLRNDIIYIIDLTHFL